MKYAALSLFLTLPVPVAVAQSDEQFQSWDKNKDGKVSREELPPALRRNFDVVDRDDDGFISPEEHGRVQRRMTARRAGPPELEGVKILRDIPYADTEDPRQTLDLYLPQGAEKPLPLVVWIHGGGWRQGSKDRARYVTELVKTGKFAGASIGYRLTDEAQWPAQIHDCKAAIRWLKANASKHGYDPEKIAVWGSSAGGHLVAMLGVTNSVKHLEGDLGNHTDQSSEVNCVVNYFGPAELLKMDAQGSSMKHDAPDSPEGKLVGGPIQELKEKARDASPITHVSADDEPMLIIHGTKDPLVPYQQSVDFEKALEKACVPTILVTVKEGGHGQGFGPKTLAAAVQFLEKQLLGIGELPADQEVAAEAARR